MTTLHDRLRDLADDAPPGGPAPDLWERGRRYHRRRRAGTALIVALVAVAIGAVGIADWVRARPQPAPASAGPALPDRLWSPSPWLPGTVEEGELGRLAAVIPAERGGWTGTRPGVVGVSATTGEYRFLDLPDLVGHTEVALSPDGRLVAYWLTGDTRRSPNSDSGPVVGVGVYDAATGSVVRHLVATDHGLYSETLDWADSERLVFSYGQYLGGDGDDVEDQNTSRSLQGLLVWQPTSGGDPHPVALPLRDFWEVVDSTGRGQLLLSGRRPVWVDLDRPERLVGVRGLGSYPGLGGLHSVAVDEAGTRVAWPAGSGYPASIQVRSIGVGPSERARVPGTAGTFSVVGWLDDHHVAAVQRGGSDYVNFLLTRVDVRTGESELIARFDTDLQFATDLLVTPSVQREAPPRPLDPRGVAAGILALLLTGGVALVSWRRRVRA